MASWNSPRIHEGRSEAFVVCLASMAAAPFRFQRPRSGCGPQAKVSEAPPWQSPGAEKTGTLKGFRKNRVQSPQVVDEDVFNAKTRFLCNSSELIIFLALRSQRDAALTLGCGARPFQGRCSVLLSADFLFFRADFFMPLNQKQQPGNEGFFRM